MSTRIVPVKPPFLRLFLDRSDIAPTVHGNATQILAPFASLVVGVEVVEENNEDNDDHDEEAGTDQPPRPPERLPALEEADGVLDEGGRSLASVL